MAVTPPQINAKMACSGPLEPANSARRGHPRMVPRATMSSKGRTKLKISLSRAKNVKEAAGTNLFIQILRNFPDVSASKRIQMHPNASECIRAHPNRSKQLRKPRKTSGNVEKLPKNSPKIREKCSRSLVSKENLVAGVACDKTGRHVWSSGAYAYFFALL